MDATYPQSQKNKLEKDFWSRTRAEILENPVEGDSCINPETGEITIYVNGKWFKFSRGYRMTIDEASQFLEELVKWAGEGSGATCYEYSIVCAFCHAHTYQNHAEDCLYLKAKRYMQAGYVAQACTPIHPL